MIQTSGSNDVPVLTDGAPLPDPPASTILSFFSATPLDLQAVLDRGFVRALLGHVDKKAPGDTEFEAAIRLLISRGMLKEASGPPRRTPALPAMLGALGLVNRKPKDDDPCYVLTGLGRKASTFAHSQPWGIGPWSVGPQRLTDQILIAINQSASGADFVALDAHCCFASEDKVREALSHLRASGLIEENNFGQYCLSETGSARAAELSAEIKHLALQKMSAAANAVANSAPEFDVSFVTDAALRKVLERNIGELSRAMAFQLHTATIVLSGAIGEGVLYHALVSRKGRAMLSTKAPQKAGAAIDPELDKLGWSLSKYIDVAIDLGLVRNTVGNMAHGVLREFRNMIHPKVQVDKNLVPDATVAEASTHCLKALLNDIRGAGP